MGIPITDFVTERDKNYSYKGQIDSSLNIDYAQDDEQLSLFDFYDIELPKQNVNIKK